MALGQSNGHILHAGMFVARIISSPIHLSWKLCSRTDVRARFLTQISRLLFDLHIDIPTFGCV